MLKNSLFIYQQQFEKSYCRAKTDKKHRNYLNIVPFASKQT